jgi:hypothetical protein
MAELHETRMGQRFYESTMPAVARELERLNGILERAVKAFERKARTVADSSRQEPKTRR